MTIAQAEGWLAEFEHSDGKSSVHRVVLWRETAAGATGLIRDPKTGHLRAATKWDAFRRYVPEQLARVRGAVVDADADAADAIPFGFAPPAPVQAHEEDADA